MNNDKKIVVPTARQIEWADCEVGVLIHFDLEVYAPHYFEQYPPHDRSGLKLFNPDNLDTDQWIETAVKAGAKYALLTARHGTGFTLFPSTANDFSIADTPYQNGKGDIVASFVASCKKYGVRPGFYYNTGASHYHGFAGGLPTDGDRTKLEAYNRTVLQQVEELWSRYGELFEIWFDGGCLPPEQGGPDIVPLLRKYQPNAITYQSPPTVPNGIRWVGNEEARAEKNTWSTMEYSVDSFDGVSEVIRAGDPWGEIWRGVEADIPIRRARTSYSYGWIWREGEDHAVYSPEDLFDTYLLSVGRNCNLLIGMVIDEHGLCPQADVDAFTGFGKLVKERLGTPLAEYKGDLHAMEYHLSAPEGKEAKYVVVMEDISQGERVLEYNIAGHKRQSIGHKRIEPIPDGFKEVTITIQKCKDTPALKGIWLY